MIKFIQIYSEIAMGFNHGLQIILEFPTSLSPCLNW